MGHPMAKTMTCCSTTSRRIAHNVGHVLTAINRSQGVHLYWGDFKASQRCAVEGKIPDMVIMDRYGNMRVVGEGKTPWVHNLTFVMLDAQEGFRNYLGKSIVNQCSGNLNADTFLGIRPDSPVYVSGEAEIWFPNDL